MSRFWQHGGNTGEEAVTLCCAGNFRKLLAAIKNKGIIYMTPMPLETRQIELQESS